MIPSARLMRAARVLAELSQAELAAEAQVAVNTVRLFERGLTSPRVVTLSALVEALARRGVELLPAHGTRKAGLALIEPDPQE